MDNLKRVLEGSGSSLDPLALCTVDLVDMCTPPTFRTSPARRVAGVASLVFNARVEIECVAV